MFSGNILITVSLHKLMGCRTGGYFCFQGALKGEWED